LSLKALSELKGIEEYFFVTSSISGLIGDKNLDISGENVWEIFGSLNYY